MLSIFMSFMRTSLILNLCCLIYPEKKNKLFTLFTANFHIRENAVILLNAVNGRQNVAIVPD